MKRNANNLNANEYKVLDYILKNPGITSLELADILEVTPAAISKILKTLRERKYIFEESKPKNIGKGRPRKIMRVNVDMKLIIGVNFGADFIDVTVGKLDGSIVETKRKRFFIKKKDSLITLLLNELDNVIDKYGKKKIVGIGLALNGIVNINTRTAIFSPYFKWKNLKIGEMVEERYEIPTLVDNDVRAMLNAEMRFGIAKGMENAFFLYMKNGIGGAIMVDKKIYRGSNQQAGEFGHFVINKNSNFVCKCGKVGCIETEFSENTIKLMITSEYEESSVPFDSNLSIREIYDLANSGNKYITPIVANVSYKIGEALGNILNVIDIRNIIVAGDIINAGDVFKTNFKKGLRILLSENFCNHVDVYITSLGNNAEKYGAMSLVMNNLFSDLKLIK